MKRKNVSKSHLIQREREPWRFPFTLSSPPNALAGGLIDRLSGPFAFIQRLSLIHIFCALALAGLGLAAQSPAAAAQAERADEFRAVWVATVYLSLIHI